MEKVDRMPPKAQEEVLRQVEQIEEQFNRRISSVESGNLRLSHNEQIDEDLAREYGTGLDDD